MLCMVSSVNKLSLQGERNYVLQKLELIKVKIINAPGLVQESGLLSDTGAQLLTRFGAKKC